MTPRVAVTLVDAVTALGDDLATSFRALAGGATGFAPVPAFDLTRAVNDRAACWAGGRSAAGALTELLRRATAGGGPLRVDRAYVAVTPDEPPPALPDTVRREAGPGAEPGGWDRVYTGACVSSSSALLDAAAAIAHGWCERILVAATRGLDRETFHLFSAGGAMTRQPAMHPLTGRRSGVLLGEGAAIFLLAADGALAGRAPVAEIRGWARTGDAFHPCQPDPSGTGMARALREALAGARLDAGDLDLVSVHGTATELNDAAEAAALTEVFGGAVPPTFAPKGALGHTLEAAGLVESAVAVQSLVTGVVPPTAGLAAGDEPLVAGVTGEPARRAIRHVAKLNLAFGGCNTVLVLSRWDAARAAAAERGDTGPVPPARLLAAVGTRPAPPPVPGFLRSGFPAAVRDAAARCLAAAGLTEAERARTALVVLAPQGDVETRAAVRACLTAGRRPPPPLFVQSAPSSIGGVVAREWRLGGGVTVLASRLDLADPRLAGLAAELAAGERAAAVLLVRHLPPGEGSASLAEAALYAA